MMYSVPSAVFLIIMFFFFSSRRRHTRCSRDWSSDVCSSDLISLILQRANLLGCSQPCRQFWAAIQTLPEKLLAFLFRSGKMFLLCDDTNTRKDRKSVV